MNDAFWEKKLELQKMCEISLILKPDERIIFVSDVHLSSINKSKNEIFTKFLKTIDTSVKAIFIIGDLFNYYVGAPQGEDEIYSQVFSETKKLHENGTKLFFLPGNRDFFAFRELQRFGIVTLPIWAMLQLRFSDISKRILLTHGDNLMVSKHDYRFYSKIIRSKIAYWIFSLISFKVRIKIAKFMRKALAAKYIPKYKLEDYLTDFSFLKPGYVNAFKYPVLSKLADVLISGHWHLRANIRINPGEVFVIGDWRYKEGAYIEIKNGDFKHDIFTDKN